MLLIKTWIKLALSGVFLSLNSANATNLYSNTDPIVQLNVSSFYSTLLNKNHAWLIEFYSSWCGHCINFAPLFIHLAKEVEGWRRTIQVGAVDCGDDSNLSICRQYEITGYPTLKFFKPYSNMTDLGIKYLGSKRPDVIQRNMIDFIMLLVDQNVAPRNWPGFSLTQNVSLNEEFQKYGTEKLGLIFDNETTIPYWLKESILDLQGEDFPPLLRVSSDRQDIIDTFNITRVPTLVIVESIGKFQLHEFQPTRESLVKLVESLFQVTDSTSDPQTTTVSEIPPDATAEHVSLSPTATFKKDEVYVYDLEGAIQYAFRHEVSQHKVIEGDGLNALKLFLDVLDDYFPGRPLMRNAISRLKEKLKLFKEKIYGEDFANLWREAHSGHYNEIEWVGCRGSKPHLRGYPCSLWITFHTLTVNHALKYPSISLDAPNRVLLAMKAFVKNFFGCAHCAAHFVGMAEDPSNPVESVKTPKDEVLWLWSAHNKVNQRIAKSLSEDPTAPKVQFPTSENCQACLSGDNYDKETVFKYLVDLYAPTAINLEKGEVKPSVVSSGGGHPMPFEFSALALLLETLISFIQLPAFF